MVNIVGKLQDGISNFFKDFNIKVNKVNKRLYYRDFNTNKHFKNLYKNDEGKALTLYLLHILSTINSVIRIFKEYEKDDYGWWMRIYYITYYYAMERLKDIKNHIDMNSLSDVKSTKFYSSVNVSESMLKCANGTIKIIYCCKFSDGTSVLGNRTRNT